MLEKQNYSLKMEQRGTYVVATVRSLPEPRPASDPCYLTHIAKHCAKCHCTAVLIDKHTNDPFEVWDAMNVAPTLARIGHDDLRIAVVEQGTEPPSQRQLSIAVGANRRLKVQIFTDCDAAEDWLLQEEVQTSAEN